MTIKEQLMPDGSLTTSTGGGGFFIEGGMAMERYRVISAISGLEWNLKTGGHIRRNYTRDCLIYITSLMEQFSDEELASVGMKPFKPYPRSRQGKERAVEDAKWLLSCFNASAVVVETEDES